MKAAVLTAPEQIRIIDLPAPADDPARALVSVESAGICGTDVATVVLFGAIGRSARPVGHLPFYDLYYKELVIRSPRAARHHDYQLAIELAAVGRLDLGPFWSQGFVLEAAADALAATQDPGKLKITLDPASGGRRFVAT